MIGLMVVLLTFFEWWVCSYFNGELMLFYGMDIEFKGKIMLYRFREVKCLQGITTGVWYWVYNVSGQSIWLYISGLMDSKPELKPSGPGFSRSNLHDINHGRQSVLLPWRFPDRHIPALATYAPNSAFPVSPFLTDFDRGTTKNYYSSTTVHQ